MANETVGRITQLTDSKAVQSHMDKVNRLRQNADESFAKLRDQNDSLRSENERLKGEVDALKSSQRWIPVSERLPGKMGHYIALYQRTDNHAPLLMIATFIGGEWSVERQHMPDKFERLTHWFPTPPLPEVKE